MLSKSIVSSSAPQVGIGLRPKSLWPFMRMKGHKLFGRKPMPTWGAELDTIDFDNIKYFVRSTEKQATSWEELPEEIKNTYDRLGIPEAEKQRLVAGVAAQDEAGGVSHPINEGAGRRGGLL